MLSIAFQVAFHLFFQFRRFAFEGSEHVFDESRGLVGIQSAAADPLLSDPSQSIRHKRGGAEAAEQQLLKRVAGVHRN